MVDFLAVAKYRGGGWRGRKEEVVGSGGVLQLNCESSWVLLDLQHWRQCKAPSVLKWRYFLGWLGCIPIGTNVASSGWFCWQQIIHEGGGWFEWYTSKS